jgi:hypothetical protein
MVTAQQSRRQIFDLRRAAGRFSAVAFQDPQVLYDPLRRTDFGLDERVMIEAGGSETLAFK